MKMPTRYIEMGYWEIASRQMSIVTKSQQKRFKESIEKRFLLIF